jgi:plastocyanin
MIAAAALAVAPLASAADKPVVVIKMTDKPPVYIPAKVTIKVGQTVEWINNAATLHDVNADVSSVQNTKDVSIPPGAKPFDSGFMRPGMTFDYTFTVPGTYRYTCVPHEKDGMNGTVVVTK